MQKTSSTEQCNWIPGKTVNCFQEKSLKILFLDSEHKQTFLFKRLIIFVFMANHEKPTNFQDNKRTCVSH